MDDVDDFEMNQERACLNCGASFEVFSGDANSVLCDRCHGELSSDGVLDFCDLPYPRCVDEERFRKSVNTSWANQ